eukprot:5376117-Pyramimonas_sp.AAC.1
MDMLERACPQLRAPEPAPPPEPKPYEELEMAAQALRMVTAAGEKATQATPTQCRRTKRHPREDGGQQNRRDRSSATSGFVS